MKISAFSDGLFFQVCETAAELVACAVQRGIRIQTIKPGSIDHRKKKIAQFFLGTVPRGTRGRGHRVAGRDSIV